MSSAPAKANINPRTLTLGVMLMAALTGVATRWNVSSHSTAPARPIAAILSELRLAPDLGEIKNILIGPVTGLRLKLSDCAETLDAYPLWLTSTASPVELDKYYPAAQFKSVEVYRGEIAPRFSRLELMSRYILAHVSELPAYLPWNFDFHPNPMELKAFVRMYLHSRCEVAPPKLQMLSREIIGTRPFTIP